MSLKKTPKMEPQIDPDGNITIDFSKVLLPMTATSELKVVLSDDLYFIMKPISTSIYFKYTEMMDEADNDKKKQKEARVWLVSACIVEPKDVDVKKMYEEVIGVFYMLFNTLMNMSFLQKTV